MEGKGVGLQRNKLKGILKVKKNNIFLDQDPPVKGGSEIGGGGVGVKFIDGFKKRKNLTLKNHLGRKAKTFVEASCSVNSFFFSNHDPLGKNEATMKG